MAVVERCDFRPGYVIDNTFTVKKLLGEGSYGAVYLVEDIQRGGQYALKLLRLWEVPSEIRDELKGRFDVEFKTGQINSPNLVQSFVLGKVEENPYIIMEFCPGGDLQPYLGKSEGRAVQICHDILSGLHALHAQGKVHRDLKPENVLFKKDGRAALTDFGISGDRNHRMTQCNFFNKPNQIFGTWAYMPPEQVNRARGGATVLPTTDIFSFGVLAYQLLTGVLPFGKLETHNDLAEYTDRGKKGNWDRMTLSRVPGGQSWEQLIGGCLVPDFKTRLQSVREVMQLLPQQNTRKPLGISLEDGYKPSAVTNGYLLRILHGEDYGKTFNLTQMVRSGRRILTVGRQSDNNIFIKSVYSTYVSRYHCTLETNPDFTQWMVRDGQWNSQYRQWLLSRNGTFVNSRPVGQNGFYLQAGDIITMGDMTMRFENY